MPEEWSRRKFITISGGMFAGVGSLGWIGNLAAPAYWQEPAAGPAPPPGPGAKGPRLDLDRVQEFVIAGHRDLEKVKQLLALEPALVNAAWDWGGGDWETALGGASHMGRDDIALYLLDRGARLDLFAAAMLGKLEVIRAAVAAFPDAASIPGPHGITLLAHAQAGRERAAAVVEYLMG